MVKNLTKIAISSIGSGIGQSIIQSCRLSRLPLQVVGLGSNPMAFGAFDCDEHDLVPPIREVDYAERLLEKCLQYQVELLIPGLDNELPILAPLQQDFHSQGVRIMIADPGFIELCRDKLKLGQALRPISSAFVACYDRAGLIEAEARGALFFPLIAKPRDGMASRGLLILRDRTDLEKVTDQHVIQELALPRREDPNFEVFMEGLELGLITQVSEISIELVVSKNGQVLGRTATYNKLKDGAPVEIIPIEEESLWEPIDRVIPFLKSLGMRGPVNIQGRLTAEGPRFFEINARFTGITGLRAMIGFNEVETLIADFLDLQDARIPGLKTNSRRIGMRQMLDRALDIDRDLNVKGYALRTGLYSGKRERCTVLVTGAAGYLGRNFVENLLREEWVESIVAVVRDAVAAEEILPVSDGRLQILEWQDIVNGRLNFGMIDKVCHMAFARSKDGPEAIADSLKRTWSLVKLITQYQVPAVLHVSSQAVYGCSRPPLWPEDLAAVPETTYGEAKWATELMLQACADLNPIIKVTSVRSARLYGAAPGMRWHEMPHLFARQAVEQSPIIIQGGSQTLDLLHIDDAVRGLIALLQKPEGPWLPIYNLGSGRPASISEIAEAANEAVVRRGHQPTTIEIRSEPNQQTFGMDISRITEDIGWKPETTLQAGMDGLVDLLLKDQK